MKTIATTLAASFILAGTAFAQDTMSVDENSGFGQNMHMSDQMMDDKPIWIDRYTSRGREVIERFTVNADGSRNVLSRSFGSSNS